MNEWIDHAAESEMREKRESKRTPIFEHTILPPHTHSISTVYKQNKKKKM